MCFGSKKDVAIDHSQPAQPIIVHTPPPSESRETFPSFAERDGLLRAQKDPNYLSTMDHHDLVAPARPRTPIHNKRSSRPIALVERNRLSDIDSHEVQRASHGDLGESYRCPVWHELNISRLAEVQ